MIKDILVSIPIGLPSQPAVNYAVSIAREYDAHLTGVAFAYEPVVPGTIFDAGAASIIETYLEETEKAGRSAVAQFKAAVQGAGINAEPQLLRASVAGAGEVFSQMARRFDLAVVGQNDPGNDSAEELLIEPTLFGSGRPILVVPYIQKTGLTLDRVLVCWDGSRSAARAVGDALPLLKRAKSMDVLTVAKSEGARDELPGADLAHHLARHGMKVELKRIVAADIDASNAILSHAADAGADFIVMGGYGHSRLREFVLGGVTRDILASMTVPVLMSH